MNGMSGRRRVIQRLFLFLILLPGLFWRPAPVAAAGSSSGIPLVTALIYSQIHNLTKIFRNDITRTLGYCIKDVDTDLNEAFNFTNLDFMNDCVKESKDVTQRLCTAAEMKFYFSSFLESKSDVAQFLPPNNNCNLSSWTSGCEPGWACAVAGNTKSDLKNAKNIPDRTTSCQPCCAGFFCPRGLTCMIPCPLGSYCPRATLNKATGVCDPYRYQLPAGNPNHTCGGADMWAGVTSAEEIFCSSGSFCPTNTKEVRCTEGHYCRQGSTAEKACFKLSTCNPNTETQNLHGLGVLLIGALSFILFIFYNFSDQVITTKYQRLAKSREAAARSARETAQARERWKSAKDVAKKGAAGLTSSLSRTFSKKTGKPDPVLPPKAQPRSKKKGENNLTQMMQNIGDDPENPEGFDMAIGDRHIKKQKIKAKQLHTKSQIFKYAYGQLEKEKAMEQHTRDMTFSGIISMATDDEVRTRPTLEVDFKDLTLTLQGKNKHLLRCVTGKLQPGRISAVMGPSGAGKTTFLSAVLGRATGCTITGSILINGRPDSIQHYKKILGFVPQDDIVHGNLTVEENLRFSARCRLPADMPKPDKVLVVERVIDSLGLQGVRDSLVGTVEVRGISGGQKKRVNVGLELVMEPSLLILDEPTTGLDSSSSNLLLKALRREALEGVNISMVVHQPSYTLFNMFDDFILLAKGGLTVYHGPVKRVEEYFSGIGINVPDRVVPADYLIDILEGIEKLEGKLTVEQLPVRWMLHNGYTVPHDMMQYLDEIASSSKGGNTNPSGAPAQLTDAAFQEKLDNLPSSLMLFHRVTPGVSRQLRYYIGRVCKQRLREAKIQAVDYLILLLAGACLGTLSKVKGDTFGYRGYMYTVIAVSLLIKISALRSFTLDKLEYYRESGSGMSSLAYFLSKDTVDHFNTLIKPLVFLSMFYFFNNPRSTFTDNYIVLVCLVYCVTGMAYVFAIFLDPGPAQLWSVLLPVVLTLVANQDQEDRIGQLLANYCYPKWAMEAFVIANAQRYGGVWLITRCGTLLQLGYSLHDWTRCLVFLILAGIGCRILAFVLLVTFVKK